MTTPLISSQLGRVDRSAGAAVIRDQLLRQAPVPRVRVLDRLVVKQDADTVQQRAAEAKGAEPVYVGGTTNELTADTDPIQREFFDFYRTPRGAHTPAGYTPLQTTKPTLSSVTAFLNFYPFERIDTISPRPMLFITGDTAHSREFSEDAYQRATEPKELYIVPKSGHVDLYDRVNLIPFDKLTTFFTESLK